MRRIILLLIFALGCQRSDRLFSTKGTPIILISIDTLRSDHLPAYGYSRVETPAIDQFRADSILYQRAYSHCPLTLVSHASMFTGQLPAEHGIRDNIGYRLNPKSKTLAQILKANGYATGGAVSAIVLRGETGIKRGFDFWDDDIDVDPNFATMGRAQRDGDETREIAERWIREHEANPFFFFFHIYEPHSPYDPPEPFRTKYGATYDGDVAAADAVIGRFLAFLKNEGIYDRATIILLSDHGEGLGDHGESEHGILLYREALQVPLMLKLPKSRAHGKSISTPIQLIDIFPTIAQAFGVVSEGEGKSLLAALDGEIRGDRRIYSETYYPRFHFGWSDLHSMINAENHYIQAPTPELYDIVADPGEKKNVLQQNRRSYIALHDAIAPYVKGAEAPKAIDPEQARKLAALGYIGSTISTKPGQQLPDPKDKIGTSGKIKEAFVSFEQHRYEDATRQFAQLLRENPNMIDVWAMDARALASLGRYDEAIAAAKEGLKLAPATSSLVMLIANVSLELNRLDDAEKHASLMVNDSPTEAHRLLSQVWLARKKYDRALAEAQAASTRERERPFVATMRGRIAQDQGKLEDALRDFDEALAMIAAKHHKPIPKLNFFRGDTLARLGRAEEAEAAFRQEIEFYPTDPQAYKNLILLYVAEGKSEAATQLVFSLEKASPTPPAYVAISETLKIVGDRNGARFWAARGLNRYPSDRKLQALLRS